MLSFCQNSKEQDIGYDCTGLPLFNGDEKDKGKAKSSLDVTFKWKDEDIQFREAISVLRPVPSNQKDKTTEIRKTAEHTHWSCPPEGEVDEHPKYDFACTAGVAALENIKDLAASTSSVNFSKNEDGHCKENLAPLQFDQQYDAWNQHAYENMASNTKNREKHPDMELFSGHSEPSTSDKTDKQNAKHLTLLPTDNTCILQSHGRPYQLPAVFQTKSEETDCDAMNFSTSFSSEMRSADVMLLNGERDLGFQHSRNNHESKCFSEDDTLFLMGKKKYHIPVDNCALVPSGERSDGKNTNKGNHVSFPALHAATTDSAWRATEPVDHSLLKPCSSSVLYGMHKDLQSLNRSATSSALEAEAEDHDFSGRLNLRPELTNRSLETNIGLLTTPKPKMCFNLQQANDMGKSAVSGQIAPHAPSPLTNGTGSSIRLGSLKVPDSSTDTLLRFSKCLPPQISECSSSGVNANKSLHTPSSYWQRPTTKAEKIIFDHDGRNNQRQELLSDNVSHHSNTDDNHYPTVKANPLLRSEKVNSGTVSNYDENEVNNYYCLPPCRHPISRRVSTIWFPTPIPTLSTKVSQYNSKNQNPSGFNPTILYFGEELRDDIPKLMPPPKTVGRAHERETRRRPYTEIGAATRVSEKLNFTSQILPTKQHCMAINGYEADNEGENTLKIKREKMDSIQTKSCIAQTKKLATEMGPGLFSQRPVSAVCQESMTGHTSSVSKANTSSKSLPKTHKLL